MAELSTVSIGLAITIFGAIISYVVLNERRMSKIEATGKTNTSDIASLKEEIVPRREIDLMLKEMEKTLKRIEEAVNKK